MRLRSVMIIVLAGLIIGTVLMPTLSAEIVEPKRRGDIGLRKLADEIDTISVVGRLKLEPGEKEDLLVLHGKDSTMYRVIGELVEKLKSVLLDLGVDNLVSVTGVKHGDFDLACHNAYKFDSEGKKIIESRCIRYYILKVTKINEAKKSDEKMPPPEIEAQKALGALSPLQSQGLVQMGELEGKISAINLRTPIKTVEVTYPDKDGRLINGNFLLTSRTRIARSTLEGEEPIYVSINSLEAGQKVTLVYSRDERQTEALFITIKQE